MLRNLLISGLSRPVSSKNVALVRPLVFRSGSSHRHLNRRMLSTTPFSKEEQQQMEKISVLKLEAAKKKGVSYFTDI